MSAKGQSSPLAPTQSNATLEERLIEQARALIPTLRSRERAAIEAGQVPRETIESLTEAGFFKVLQPSRHGGFELPPRVYCEIARTLAEGCMSSAWVYAVIAVHNWQLVLFSDQAARDVWGRDPNVRISSSYMPVGSVRPGLPVLPSRARALSDLSCTGRRVRACWNH